MDTGVDGELHLCALARRSVVFESDDLVLFVSNKNSNAAFALQGFVHGKFDSFDASLIALIVHATSGEFLGNVFLVPLANFAEEMAGESTVRVCSARPDGNGNAGEVCAVSGQLGELTVVKVGFVGEGDKAAVCLVMNFDGAGEFLPAEAILGETGNDPLIDDAGNVLGLLGFRHSLGAFHDFIHRGGLFILLLPTLINVFEIENDLVAAAILGEDHATSINDDSPYSGFANGDGMSGGNIGNEVGALENLEVVEPGQQRAASHQHQSGEEVETEAVFWFHGE